MPNPRPLRADFLRFHPQTTRIRDNDLYRHMHNVTYYEFFDTAVNEWLIEEGGLVLPDGPVIGLVVETRCTYIASLKWPGVVEVGMRVERIGNTSITFVMGLFGKDAPEASAEARYIHVYVDARGHRPVPIPPRLRAAAEALSLPAAR